MDKIKYENIVDNFYYGKYGDIKIIIDIETGYANVSKIGYEYKRIFSDWEKLTETRNFIDIISSETELPIDNLVMTIKADTIARTILSGTYVHPLIASQYYYWVSPKFAAKATKIINDHYVKKAIQEKKKEIQELKNKVESNIFLFMMFYIFLITTVMNIFKHEHK